MTRAELITQIAARFPDITIKDVELAVKAMLEAQSTALVRGDRIEIRGFESFDPVLVASAVHAFVEVVLGRRLLVWGGQPAITPIIWEAARRLDVRYERSVLLYQSAFFKDRYPQANIRFDNWVEVPAVEGDQRASLKLMREKMFLQVIRRAFRCGND